MASAGERVIAKTSGRVLEMPAAPNADDTVEYLNMSGGATAALDANGGAFYGTDGNALADGETAMFRFVAGTIGNWKRTG